MDVLNKVFYVFTIVVPVVVGAYMVVFNRRFTQEVFRQQNALWKRTPWKVRFPENWVPFYRVFAMVVGSILFVGGLAYAARELSRL